MLFSLGLFVVSSSTVARMVVVGPAVSQKDTLCMFATSDQAGIAGIVQIPVDFQQLDFLRSQCWDYLRRPTCYESGAMIISIVQNRV